MRRRTPRNSPPLADSQPGAAAACRCRASLCYRCGSHSWMSPTRRCGDACWSPRKVRLADVAGVGERIGYEYDFGDSWEHELLIEACTKAEAHQTYPACTAGEGACPPEDSQLPGTQGDPRRPVQQRVRGDADLGGVADLRHVRSRKLRPGRGQRKSVDRLTHLGMRRPVRVPRLPIGPASHRLSRSAPRRCQPEQTGRVAADASFGRFGERAALPRPTSPSQRRPGTGT